MRHLGRSYFIGMGVFLFVFVNFIACGSKFYQVSLDNDLEDKRIPEEAKNPNSTQYGIHAAQGWTELPIVYKFGEDMNQMQKMALMKAMQTWEKMIGKTLFKYVGIHKGKTGDSFPDLYSSLSDGVNGHYMDTDWKKTAKPPVVLATTIWDNANNDLSLISAADIRFNSENYLIGDSLLLNATNEKEVVDMESLALHELGHLIGLAHVESQVDAMSIMNPQLFIGEGLTARKLSRGDIDRIQQIYGCEGAACDVDALVREMEMVSDTNTTAASATSEHESGSTN